jgi:hypothetical protein
VGDQEGKRESEELCGVQGPATDERQDGDPSSQEQATHHTAEDRLGEVMREPEMIEIKERVIDPRDLCQWENPMAFCSQCGTYLHCKHDDEIEYRRREEKE